MRNRSIVMAKQVLLLGAGVFFILIAESNGQIRVGCRLNKKEYVAFESIRATVTITNMSGRDVILQGPGGKSWLRFRVENNRGILTPREGAGGYDSVFLKQGKRISYEIDLGKMYPLNRYGDYRVKALVYFPKTQEYFASRDTRITVTDAKEIWSQVVSVPGGMQGAGTFRKYSLLRYRNYDGSGMQLYVRVKDERGGRVQATYSLGRIALVREPQAMVDNKSQLHVLCMPGPRTHVYHLVRIDGKHLKEEVYREVGSKRVQLVSDDNNVIHVVGGVFYDPDKPLVERKVPQRKLSDRPTWLRVEN